jgi:methionyl-tRNA synthetase
LTGTDENGQKLMSAAKNAGKSVKEFVDTESQKFLHLCKSLNISNNIFIRTSGPFHHQITKFFWRKLRDQGDIYLGQYEGWYCDQCEAFLPSNKVEDNLCPYHHVPLTVRKEEGHFLKISKYVDWLKGHIRNHPDFIVPNKYITETLNRLDEEVKDLSISRVYQNWGIAVPDDPKFAIYTWFDALISYYSGLPDKNYWPANTHVIGKDILWFHAVIWPIILHAMDMPLPGHIYVHGMILASDGKKMSKSLNNGIDPLQIINNYPVESFRFYLLSAISSTEDGPFITDDLISKHNKELANDLGNLLMRVTKLNLTKGPSLSYSNFNHALFFHATHREMAKLINSFNHHKAILLLWEKVYETNQYINEQAPWKLKDDNHSKFDEVIYNTFYALLSIAYLLAPAMPNTALRIFEQLGIPQIFNPLTKFQDLTFTLAPPKVLFTKIDVK